MVGAKEVLLYFFLVLLDAVDALLLPFGVDIAPRGAFFAARRS